MLLSAAAANCMTWIEEKKFHLHEDGAEEKSLDNSCLVNVCDEVKKIHLLEDGDRRKVSRRLALVRDQEIEVRKININKYANSCWIL